MAEWLGRNTPRRQVLGIWPWRDAEEKVDRELGQGNWLRPGRELVDCERKREPEEGRRARKSCGFLCCPRAACRCGAGGWVYPTGWSRSRTIASFNEARLPGSYWPYRTSRVSGHMFRGMSRISPSETVRDLWKKWVHGK